MSKILLAQIGTGVLGGNRNLNTQASIGIVFNQLFTYAVIAGALLVFYHLVMGALEWIQSAGDKEKVEKARKRMTNAAVGLVILMCVWTVFFVLTSDVLGIFQRNEVTGAIEFKLPSLFGN